LPDTWYDGDGTPFQPQVNYFVGGATKMYGAALYRLRPEDFGQIKHADGISPALPLSYARCLATSCPCIPTPRASEVRRKPAGCCLTAIAGTTNVNRRLQQKEGNAG
jgi:hypothetical protein